MRVCPSAIPDLTEIASLNGKLVESDFTTVLEKHGFDLEPWQVRDPAEMPIDEQDLIRQRTIWLNNKYFVALEAEKKRLAEEVAGDVDKWTREQERQEKEDEKERRRVDASQKKQERDDKKAKLFEV